MELEEEGAAPVDAIAAYKKAVELNPRSKLNGAWKVPSPLPRYTCTAPSPLVAEPAIAMSCLPSWLKSPTTTEVE